MNRWLSRRIVAGGIPVLVMTALALSLPGVTGRLDDTVQDLRFRLRGEVPADSSVVVLYLDNEDISSLGGWPLRRSYYALLVDALHDLGVRSVGFDIAFSEPDIHGTEYDTILAAVIKRSGNVVLSGYFRHLTERGSDTALSLPEDTIPSRFTIGQGIYERRIDGLGPVLPIPLLCEAASGLGHSVVMQNNTIPLMIRTGSGRYLPSLGCAMLLNGTKTVTIPYRNDITLNYRGGSGSLRTIPIVRFLQSYGEWKEGKTPGIGMDQFRGKFILIGVVAEGRSTFVGNPFTDQFPSIGLHALAISDILHGSYLRYVPAWMNALVSLLIGIASIILMRQSSGILGFTGIAAVIASLVVLSYFFFVSWAIVFPVSIPVFTALAVGLVMSSDAHRTARTDLKALVTEKYRLTDILQEKEKRVSALEEMLKEEDRPGKTAESVLLKNEIQRLSSEIHSLRERVADVQAAETGSSSPRVVRREFEGIVYNGNGPMSAVIELVQKVADSNATVLILGESGTGKELVARALHCRSARTQEPFVAINCGGLTETLLESELFGYEKGAFTGAVKKKPGRFSLADGGTIFLDEVGETSETFQVKLLRVLQDGTFEPVGGTETRKVDVRIIAATNKDLELAVEQRQFRRDLFYRLNVISISIPPLRERIEDLPLLVEHILTGANSGMGCSTAVLKTLCNYSWKGNVRELQAVLTRASLIAKAEGRSLLRMKDLPEELVIAQQPANIEEQIIVSLREKKFSRSAISETAEELGALNRGTVAEYFRGYCFNVFQSTGWNIREAITLISGMGDEEINGRVGKKLREYLQNAVENVDRSQFLDDVLAQSKPKYKNLPQKYHQVLTELLKAAYRGDWHIS